MQLVIMVISFAPIGVFCLIGKFVITDGLDIFQEAFKYVLLLIIVLLIHAIFTYSLILKLFTNLSLPTFYRKMKDVAIFAFSTSSSAATIPVTLKTVQDDLGVDKNVSSFVIPVGATINMDGTAIMQGMATVFIAQMSGIDLTLISIYSSSNPSSCYFYRNSSGSLCGNNNTCNHIATIWSAT
jgi:Na+/H+-dicarboxylate symporter